jgi:hypothetical protein
MNPQAYTPPIAEQDCLVYFLDGRAVQNGSETIDNMEKSIEAVLAKGLEGNPEWMYQNLLMLVKMGLECQFSLVKSADEQTAELDDNGQPRGKLSDEEIAIRRNPDMKFHRITVTMNEEFREIYPDVPEEWRDKRVTMNVPYIQMFVEEIRSTPSERILGWRFWFVKTGDRADFNVGISNTLYKTRKLHDKAERDRAAWKEYSEGYPLVVKRADWIDHCTSWYASEIFHRIPAEVSNAHGETLISDRQPARVTVIYTFQRSCEKILQALEHPKNAGESVDERFMHFPCYLASNHAAPLPPPPGEADAPQGGDDFMADEAQIHQEFHVDSTGNLRFPFPSLVKHVPTNTNTLSGFVRRPWLAAFQYEDKTREDVVYERMMHEGAKHVEEGELRLDTRFRDKNRRIVMAAYGGRALAKEFRRVLESPNRKLSPKLRSRLYSWIPWIRRTFPDTSELFIRQLLDFLNGEPMEDVAYQYLYNYVQDPLGLMNADFRDDFYKRCEPFLMAFPNSKLAGYIRNQTHAAEILFELALSKEMEVWFIQPWRFMRGSDGENIIIGMLRNDPTVATYSSVLHWMEDLKEHPCIVEPPESVLDDHLTPLSHTLAMELIYLEYLRLVLDVHEDISVIAIAGLKDGDVRVRDNGKLESVEMRLHFLLPGPPGSSKSFIHGILKDLYLMGAFEEVTRRTKNALSTNENGNGRRVLMDELPAYFMKNTGTSSISMDKGQINMEKEAMSLGYCTTTAPHRDRDTGITVQKTVIRWAVQAYLTNTNDMLDAVDNAIRDRCIYRPIISRIRPGRDVVVEKYQLTENALVRSRCEAHARKWKARYAIAQMAYMLMAIKALPYPDTSVMGKMLPVMRETLAKHNIYITKQRITEQLVSYFQTIILFEAIERVFFTANSVIPPGEEFTATHVMELAPFLQGTVEQFCIAVGHMLPSFMDPMLPIVLKAIVHMIHTHAYAQHDVKKRFTQNRIGTDFVEDYHYYLLDLSSNIRDGSSGDEGLLHQGCCAIARYINSNFPLRVSVELVKDTMKNLLGTTYKSVMDYKDEGPGEDRGFPMDVAIVRQKSNSNRFGIEINREYVDYFMSWETRDFNPGKDYASIGQELVEDLRSAGDRMFRYESHLRVPKEAKIVTGLTMRYSGGETKPYCYHVSQPRTVKKAVKTVNLSEMSVRHNVLPADEEAAAEAEAERKEEEEEEEEFEHVAAAESSAEGVVDETAQTAMEVNDSDEEEEDAIDPVKEGVPIFFDRFDLESLRKLQGVDLEAPLPTVEETQATIYSSRLFTSIFGKVEEDYVPGRCRPKFLDMCQMFESSVPETHTHPNRLEHFMPYPNKVQGAPTEEKKRTPQELNMMMKQCEHMVKTVYPVSGTYASQLSNVLDTLESLKLSGEENLDESYSKVRHLQSEVTTVRGLIAVNAKGKRVYSEQKEEYGEGEEKDAEEEEEDGGDSWNQVQVVGNKPRKTKGVLKRTSHKPPRAYRI